MFWKTVVGFEYLGFYLSAQNLKCGFFMVLNKSPPGKVPRFQSAGGKSYFHE